MQLHYIMVQLKDCLEGFSEVLEDEMLDTDYSLDHLFEEN